MPDLIAPDLITPDLITPSVDDVVPLFRALHTWHAERMPLRMHTHGPNAFYRAHLVDKIDAGGWLFACDAGWGPVGYLLALPSVEAEDFQHFARRKVQLDHLYVAPMFRGQGLAGALIAAMEARMRREGFDQWAVGFHAFNTVAKARYQRAGAIPTAGFHTRRLWA